MGQKPSSNKPKLPLVWILRGQNRTCNPNPEQPIKFQYKTRRKSVDHHPNKGKVQDGIASFPNILNNHDQQHQQTGNGGDFKCKIVKTQNVAPVNRTKSEPNLFGEKRAHKHRRKGSRNSGRSERVPECNPQKFGYEIQDIDEFLAKASIEKPANIPVVLAFSSVLYQTRIGGYQAEISLPLGMVVNAVFKNQNWLYVQTPHAEEGYVSYTACMPLGIIPSSDNSSSPCWDNSTDVFPRPSGNMTDTEKLSSRSECSGGRCRSRRSRNAASTCGERSVDRLYLRAAASSKNKGTRQTLLVISSDYEGENESTVSVRKGEVVALLSTHVKGWFWVRKKEGAEGFIPAVIAGHGFL